MSLLDNVDEPDLLLCTEVLQKQKSDLEKQITDKIEELQKNNAEFEQAFASWRKIEEKKATSGHART